MPTQTSSYTHGASATPLLGDTIGARFDQAVARWPDREAIVVCDQGVRLTFAELRQAVDSLATGLLALGLKPGDRVGIWSPNNAAWVITQYATAKVGLIMVNINPALPCRLEDYVTGENPVRVIDVFVEELDLNKLGFAGMRPECGRKRPAGRPITHRPC